MDYLLGVNTPFIKKEKEILVKQHKYEGSNYSIYSHYVHSPMNVWLLDNVVPTWLA